MRARGGERYAGRAVNPGAYAYYIAAMEEEGRGDVQRAESLYLSTLKEDPASGAAWAGLIRTGCHRSRSHVDQIIASAEHAADRPALALSDYAQCLLQPQYANPDARAGRLRDARDAIRGALLYEPLLESSTSVLVKIQLQQGEKLRADRTIRAYALYARHPLSQPFEATRTESIRRIDQLVFAGEVAKGMDASVGLMSPGEFSLRLLALGFPEESQNLAETVLINEPSDPNAKLAKVLCTRPLFLGDQIDPLWQHIGRQDGLSALAKLLYLIELRRLQPKVADQLYDELEIARIITSDPLVQWWRHEYLSNRQKDSNRDE